MMKRIRIVLLVGCLAVLMGYARADDKKPEVLKPLPSGGTAEKLPAPGGTTAAAPAAADCGPGTTTIWVNEMVPETYTATRTVNRMETRTENYTAYKTECVPETRTRNVTTYKQVTETRMETRTKCITVPVCEEKTVMKTRTVCKPVTEVVRKCVDKGHYECREVPCGPSLFDKLHGHFKKKDCCENPCDPCPAPKTKTVKVWCPNPVWVETCVTKNVKVKECYAEVVKVNTCKKEYVTECVPVTCTKCVPETKCETYTVNVSRCVPCPATRTVQVCVPTQECYTATRMVCKKVAKEVAVSACCETSCCDPCGKSHGGHGFFGKLFHKKSCCE